MAIKDTFALQLRRDACTQCGICADSCPFGAIQFNEYPEVDPYNQYLSGDVYGFNVTDKQSGEELNSCYGFFGTDHIENGIFDYVSQYFTKSEFMEAMS
jgi:ferredoxin